MKEINVSRESKMIETIIDFLIDIPLFDELQPNELKIVSRQMNFIDIKKNEILFHEGDKGNYVCFVVEGILDVMKQASTGKEVVIANLSKGRSIGEMAIIDNFPRSATVRARSQASLVILTLKGFELILKESPQTGIKILRALARLLSMNLRKTSGRLADYMLPIS